MVELVLDRRGVIAGLAALAAGCTTRSGSYADGADGAMQTWIGYGYAVIAQQRRLCGDLPLRLSVVEDGNALVGGITGGTSELMGSTLDQFVLQRTNGLPARLLCLTDDSYGGDGMVVTSSIVTLADLRGKTVAYTPGPSSEYVLATALASVGMTLDDIRPVTFADPGGSVAAFVNGRVDAGIIFQPYLAQMQQRPGSRLLFTTKEFPDVSVGCFVLREGAAAEAQIAEQFILGLKAAEEVALNDPAAADLILIDFFKVDAALLNDMRAGARLKGAANNARYLSPAADGGEAAVLPMLRAIEAHYRRQNVAGARRISMDDVVPGAAAAFR